MVGSRNYHTKTRNGCRNCKKRRVRCNLQAPRCGHCERRGEECDYQYYPNSPLPASQTPEPSRSQSDAVARWPNPLPPLSQSVEPVQLLSNFVTTTATSLAWFNDSQWAWEIEVPRHAEGNAFLRHAILATSALHICFLQPPNPSEYHLAAYQNCREATLLFRSTVTTITRENCVAVLAFSLLISVFQLGTMIHQPADRTPEEASAQFIHALSALRGAWSLVGQLHSHLAQSPVSRLFVQRRQFKFEPLDRNHQQALERLESLNRLSDDPPEMRTLRAEAIRFLRSWFSLTSGHPSTWLHLVYWPASLPEGYISLLKQNDPISLVVFCHWSVGLGRGSEKWFLAGWAQQTLDLAKRLLGPEWHAALEWPTEMK
ncbi:Fungal Zn2-Cys6 binuclear cluster domain-containing protein [Cladophialophora immunda]|nr:Fungal Zn2-Cys6 binuclear cluster domain-containing protein [Cladophialophora immunda]